MTDEPAEEVALEPSDTVHSASAGSAPLVFIAQTVLDDMNAHAAAENHHEIGGIMVGTVIEGARPVVLVEGSIRGAKMSQSASSVTFTHDAWDEINRIKDERFADKRIVGWYHSHPGFGIFLSGHDQFIHRNFFTAPWQIAFVTDPKDASYGIFTWQTGDLARDHDLHLYGLNEAPVAAKAVPAAQSIPEPSSLLLQPLAPPMPQRDRGLMWALWLLSALVAFLAALTVSNYWALNQNQGRLQALNVKMDTVIQDFQSLEAQIKLLAEQPKPPAHEAVPPALPGSAASGLATPQPATPERAPNGQPDTH